MADETSTTPTPASFRVGRLAAMALGLILLASAVAWYYRLLPGSRPNPRANAIMVIAPYLYEGTWVFDDASAGLVKEPFVAGVP